MTQGQNTTTMPATGRRRFAGALLAIGAGSGITAGAAASVADLVPADADARLLAICHMAEDADRLMMDAQARFEANHDDRASMKQSDKQFERFVDLAEQAAQIPARTLDGIRAKARVVYLNMDLALKPGDLTSLILRDIGWGS